MLEAKTEKIENKLVLFEKGNKDGLDPNNILIAEYNYAVQTAFQANEDRVKVFGYIIANVATLIAAVIVPNINSSISPNLFGAIFIGLTLVGLFSLFQLSRLRHAWIDSVKAMNQIKDFYIENFKDRKLNEAFRWRTSTIPKANKIWSLSFLLSITIIFIDCISFGLGIYLLLQTDQQSKVYSAVIGGLIALVLQIIIWDRISKSN